MTKRKAKPGTSKSAAAARYELFIEAYLANGNNATQAAITAGYSRKTAAAQGSRLLKDVEIEKAVAGRAQEAAEIAGLTTENVLRELRCILFSRAGKLYRQDGSLIPINELPDEVQAAIATVKDGEVKFWDKNSAAEKAMKHLGLFEKDNKQRDPIKVEVELLG